MQITYRFTPQEYKSFRRLNNMSGMAKWKAYLLATICLLPSLLLVWLSGSKFALMAFGLMVLTILGLSLLAMFRQPATADQHDHIMTFTPTSKHEMSSYSEFESDWRTYDEFIETETDFRFRKLQRFTVIPKRIFDASQADTFRSYAVQANEAVNDEAPPVELYTRLLVAPNDSTIVEFAYQHDDINNALSEQLAVVLETDTPAKPKGKWSGFLWLGIFLLILFYLWRSLDGELVSEGPLDFVPFLYLGVAVVLPFFLIRGLNTFLRAAAKKSSGAVPTELNHMRLMQNGWAIGSPRGALFYDWRDIEAIYQNKACIGLKTMNDLVQIIPKRIFESPDAAQRFLDQIIDLRRQQNRAIEEPIMATETGNPYQPPAG